MADRLAKTSRFKIFTRYRSNPTSASSKHIARSVPALAYMAALRSPIQYGNREPATSYRSMSGSAAQSSRDASLGSSMQQDAHTTVTLNASKDASGYRHRRVVSSFICHGTPNTPSFRVSIFKRSAKVRTYPGKWAACSGSVEPSDSSPVRAALRELREETGFDETGLLRVGGGGGPVNDRGEEGFGEGGVSFKLWDENLRTVWEVWPFLWRVVEDGQELELEKIRRKMRLDWEHDEMDFVSLEEMKGMNTVEDLGRGVRVVLASLEKNKDRNER